MLMIQTRNYTSNIYSLGTADAIAETINASYLLCFEQSRWQLKRRIQEEGS